MTLSKKPYGWENQRDRLIESFKERLDACMAHGFFKLVVKGNIGKGGRREVTIEGGTSTKYTILPNDISKQDDSRSLSDLSKDIRDST